MIGDQAARGFALGRDDTSLSGKMTRMSDAPALLEAIRAAPDDDAPRLVYADWLDEHGQPERAEFIRVQCELARRKSPELRQREKELQARHHDNFAGPLAASHLRFRFHRGFANGFGHTGVFVTRFGTGMILFRFFPDGVVIGAAGHDLEAVIRPLRRDNEYVARGEYQVAGLEYPVALLFRAGSVATGEEFVFDGLFGGDWLNPGGYCHANGYSLLRRVSHHHIDGFDSFTET
jgi:uncharacterized protein (TIGR02996 family)